MVVISDTSPLSCLLAIDRLDILPSLYEEVIIPNEVAVELLRMENRKEQVTRLLASKWLKIHELESLEIFHRLLVELDHGESEAIAMALEIKADLLIIDEAKGRAVAKTLGLNVTGLLGVLLEAKQKNIINSVGLMMDTLKVEAGFWISEKVYEMVLNMADE